MKNSLYALSLPAYIILGTLLYWWAFGAFACNPLTKTVTDSVTFGDLRIEKTEYWSGCWRGYYIATESVIIGPSWESVLDTTMPATKRMDPLPDSLGPAWEWETVIDTVRYIYGETTILKDSLICSDCDSVVYRFYMHDTVPLGMFATKLNDSQWSYGLTPNEPDTFSADSEFLEIIMGKMVED